MKTSAISNLPNLGSSSASTPKQSEAAGDMPFAKVLSREMTARPKAGEKPSAAREDSRPKQASRAEAKPEHARGAEESPAPSPAEEGASVATVDNAAPLKSNRATMPVDDLREEEDVILPAASSELLALVSSLLPVGRRAEPSGDPGLAGKDDGVRLHGLEPEGTNLPADGQALNLPVVAQAAPIIPPPIAAPAQTPPAAARADEAVSADIAKLAPGTDAGTGIEQSIDPRAIVRHETDSRAGDESTGKDSAGSKDFNAQLAQAKDEKTNPGNSRTELTGQKPAIDTATPRAQQDMQAATPPSIQIGPASPARMHEVQSAASVPGNMGDRLAPRIGTPGWDQALGQKVVWMISGEQQSASLTLNPPDLGPLQIELKVENSMATASFTAAQPEVRQALEAAMPKLRDMLGEAGIQLGQASVSAGTPNNQQSAFGQSPQSSHHAGAMNEDGEAPAPAVRSQIIAGGQGLVDTFA